MFDHVCQQREVEPSMMMNAAMAETVDTDEGWARLQGLMATLALPARRHQDGVYRKPRVEVHIANAWEPIDTVTIESDRVTFSFGINGSQREWIFLRAEGIPPWREVRGADVKHSLDGK